MGIFIAILSAVFNVPVLISLLLIVFFASIGISLGVRRAYIKVLLKIFEVCIQTQTNNKIIHNFFSSLSFDIQSRSRFWFEVNEKREKPNVRVLCI